MAHKFDPKQVHKLDSPERRKLLPPEVTLERLGIGPGMTVIDLGAGSCYFALPTAGIVGNGGHVYAVDLHAELLQLCAERAAEQGIENLTVIRAEETSVPLPAGLADAVLLVNVLHEFEDPAKSLGEVVRLLKPGGRLLLVDWKKEPMEIGPPLEARLTSTQAAELLGSCGFGDPGLVEIGPAHYGLAAIPATPAS